MDELELHDEIVEWMDSLNDEEWDRVVVVLDRLATLGSTARMPFSKNLGAGLFEVRFTLGRLAGLPTDSRRTGGSCYSRHSVSNATMNATR